jgi:hypothetical protein
MCRIHHYHIHSGIHETRHTILCARPHANGCPYPKLSLRVAASQRMLNTLKNIFHRNQASQLKAAAHHKHTLNTMLVH